MSLDIALGVAKAVGVLIQQNRELYAEVLIFQHAVSSVASALTDLARDYPLAEKETKRKRKKRRCQRLSSRVFV